MGLNNLIKTRSEVQSSRVQNKIANNCSAIGKIKSSGNEKKPLEILSKIFLTSYEICKHIIAQKKPAFKSMQECNLCPDFEKKFNKLNFEEKNEIFSKGCDGNKLNILNNNFHPDIQSLLCDDDHMEVVFNEASKNNTLLNIKNNINVENSPRCEQQIVNFNENQHRIFLTAIENLKAKRKEISASKLTAHTMRSELFNKEDQEIIKDYFGQLKNLYSADLAGFVAEGHGRGQWRLAHRFTESGIYILGVYDNHTQSYKAWT